MFILWITQHKSVLAQIYQIQFWKIAIQLKYRKFILNE